MSGRFAFPLVMFAIAAAAFGYGIWEHLNSAAVQQSADQRVSFMVMTIQRSGVSEAQKVAMYRAIFAGLPSAPSVWGIKLSDSFAAQRSDDHCQSDNQRIICRALASGAAPGDTIESVCGLCSP